MMNLRVALAIFFASYLISCNAEEHLHHRKLDSEPWLTDGVAVEEISTTQKLVKSGKSDDCSDGGKVGKTGKNDAKNLVGKTGKMGGKVGKGGGGGKGGKSSKNCELTPTPILKSCDMDADCDPDYECVCECEPPGPTPAPTHLPTASLMPLPTAMTPKPTRAPTPTPAPMPTPTPAPTPTPSLAPTPAPTLPPTTPAPTPAPTPQPTSVCGANYIQRGSDIDGEAASDVSGYYVSLSSSGTVVAIGAAGNNGINGTDSGHVRVQKWNGTDWNQLGSDIDGEAKDDNSGYSVSLSGDGKTVAVGAPYNDGFNGKNSLSGHVRVFEWNETAWNQLGMDIDGEAGYDYSGWSVSLSSDGRKVAVGALRNDGNSTDLDWNSGHVRVYEWNDTVWIQLGNDIDGEVAGDYSGWSVSLSSDGKTVAVGAIYNNGITGTNSISGHVRVHEWNGTAWNQLGRDIDGEAAGDYSGYSVSLSSDGRTVAVGAIFNDGINGVDSGHVRVYKWHETAWNQLGGDIDGESIGDASGHSLSLSSDGSIVAVGAIYNNGITGTNSISGHIRVHEWNGTAWNQLFNDIDGEAAGDMSGWSVSLSSDGRIVAVGIPYKKLTANSISGQVRVYSCQP